MIVKIIKKRILMPIYCKLRLLYLLIRFGEDRFLNVEIEINSQCNFRCSYCPVSKFPREKGMLPTKTYKNVIEQLREIGFSGIISPHQYNEPLLDNRLTQLMTYTKSQLPKCKIFLYTNGNLLDKKLFNKLINAGVDKIIISQHTPKMLPTIDNLFSEISRGERKRISYVDLNSKSYILSNRGGLVKDKNLDRFYYCFSPTIGLIIDYRGFVRICCNDYNCMHTFGNVKNESIMSIWRKADFKKARRDIRNGRFNFRICQLCSKEIVDTEAGK